MHCAVCGRPIHPERLAALPRAVTCSAACSGERQRQHRAAGAVRATQQRRARERADAAASKP